MSTSSRTQHTLSSTFGSERFDAIISCSTFEHIKYPILAAHELMKTLKVGGLLYVQTHQTFALHGYPRDYCRFSREALAALFPAAMGFRVITTDYEFPARIYSRRAVDQHLHPAWLNSPLLGTKVARTPGEFTYELEEWTRRRSQAGLAKSERCRRRIPLAATTKGLGFRGVQRVRALGHDWRLWLECVMSSTGSALSLCATSDSQRRRPLAIAYASTQQRG